MSGLRTQLLKSAIGAALVATWSSTALAQSVSDFRLSPGTPTPSPRQQGPVDPDSPPPPVPASAAPTTPPSAALPSPRVTVPSPAPTPRAAAAGSAAPASQAPARTPAARTEPRRVAPAPAKVPDPLPAPAGTLPPPTLAAPVPVEPVAAPAEGSLIPWWWLFPAGLIGAGGAWTLVRRRRAEQGDSLAPSQPESATPAPRPLAPVDTPLTPVDTLSVPAPAADVLTIELDPIRFSVSLVNATLQYRLVVSNLSPAAIGPLAVAADMIGAHASLPEENQLARDGTGLELRHELAALAPGEVAEFKGELRLPLTAVTPIRSGSATLLVPLVRLRAEGPGVSLTRAIVVGEAPAVPGGLLRPFRLDTGPKIFGAVDQRGIAAAA